jgi:hypothetical protein
MLPALFFLSGVVAAQSTSPALTEFRVHVSRFVARGTNFASVEIWFSPTGTDVKPGRLGLAKRTGSGKKETWVLDIPPDVLATEIYAVGFDANHKGGGSEVSFSARRHRRFPPASERIIGLSGCFVTRTADRGSAE